MNVEENGNSIERIERHAYCLCLHVRPATIFVALVNLAGSLICAIVTLALLSYADNSNWNSMSESQRSTTTTLAIVIYMLLSLVSAMLLYGVLKSRPTYILPFFGIQFIDFLFTLPQFLTSLYSQPVNYNTWERRGNTFLDMRHIWPNASPSNLYTSSLLLTTLIVLFKSYFLCVVWKCYRYLRLKEMVLPVMPFHHNIHNDLIIPPLMVPPPHMAPPDYEEATKSYAPPDYETATKIDEFKFVPNTPESRQQSHPEQPPPQQPPQQLQTQSQTTIAPKAESSEPIHII